MPRYSYRDELGKKMLDEDLPIWWQDCPWCDYEGPEPPIPGLAPLPGNHEIWLCPSCRGELTLEFPDVVRTIAANEAIRLAAREAKDAE